MRQGLTFIPHWVLAPDFHEMSCQGELGDSLRAVFACTRGENRLSGGLTLLLFLRLSVSAVCPSSMAVAGAGTVVYLLGSFCFLGEQFQEGATVPKDLRRRGFQEKKKKKRAFNFSGVFSPELHSSVLSPLLVSIRAAPRGHLQTEVPHPGCTWNHFGSPTLDQSSWSHWGWARGTHILKIFPDDSNLSPQSRGSGLESVQAFSGSFLCSVTAAHFRLEPGGAGRCARPAWCGLCAASLNEEASGHLSGAWSGLSSAALEGLKQPFIEIFATFACL